MVETTLEPLGTLGNLTEVVLQLFIMPKKRGESQACQEIPPPVVPYPDYSLARRGSKVFELDRATFDDQFISLKFGAQPHMGTILGN